MGEREFEGLRVLLVEDESLVALLMEDILAELGCRVLGPVARIAPAIASVEEDGFDLAVLDINLGGQPVFPVAKRLAERGIPFLFVTGYSRSEIARDFRDRPMLMKPFHHDELRAAIGAAVGDMGRPRAGTSDRGPA
jgi:CheY-like chemotaxis protein